MNERRKEEPGAFGFANEMRSSGHAREEPRNASLGNSRIRSPMSFRCNLSCDLIVVEVKVKGSDFEITQLLIKKRVFFRKAKTIFGLWFNTTLSTK